METLRTIIRFLVIAIAIILLVFLSITLFNLIPKGINQLASATVSLGQRTSLTSTTTTTQTDTQKTAQAVPVTDGGLNGVYSNQGNIVVLDKAATTSTHTTYVAPRTTRATRYYVPTRTYTYTSTEPAAERAPVGGKNLKVTFSSIGVVQNGQYIATNSFNTGDTVSMRFTIINEQDSPTGPWAMRVEMPTTDATQRVKILSNLPSIPGESSYTAEARFDSIDLTNGTPVIKVFLDVNNQVAETNENDNTLSVSIPNVNNNTNYNNTNNNNNNYYYYSNNNTSNSGTANLYITSFELGRLLNGTFYPQTNINSGERLAIRARVRNSGGAFNTAWSTKVTYVDQYGNSRDFNAGSQYGLGQGAETTLTYEIDNLNKGSNTVTLTVDPQNYVSETSKSDNTMQANIYVNY